MFVRKVNGKSYVYRNRREGEKVRTEYLGALAFEFELEAFDLQRRMQAEAWRRAREEEERERAAWVRVERPVLRLHRRAMLRAEREMERRGYHRHARGGWRKRRGGPPVTTPDRIGQPARKYPKRRAPHYDNNMPRLIARAFGQHALTAHSNEQEVIREARILSGPDPSPLEKLMAIDIAIQHYLLRLIEQHLLQIQMTPANEKIIKVVEGRIAATHRRLRASIKQLDALRRTRPASVVAVQVVNNIPAAEPQSVIDRPSPPEE